MSPTYVEQADPDEPALGAATPRMGDWHTTFGSNALRGEPGVDEHRDQPGSAPCLGNSGYELHPPRFPSLLWPLDTHQDPKVPNDL